MNRFSILAGIFVLLLLTACDKSPSSAASTATSTSKPKSVATAPTPAPAPKQEAVKTLEWNDLLPRDYRPDALLEQYDVSHMSDNDPRAKELMGKLEAMWKEAPVVQALDGQTVRLPGFVVPLEGNGKVVREFLLVPYYGACIHVPPPPANQTVHVVAQGRGAKIRGLFDTVWVTGLMKIEHTTRQLAEAAYDIEANYEIQATDVKPYDD